MSPRAAYATLLTKVNYLPGVLVLHHSLVSAGARYPLVVMVTHTVRHDVRDLLTRRGMFVRSVDHLTPNEGAHSLSPHDARFGDTWTKLRSVLRIPGALLPLTDSTLVESLDSPNMTYAALRAHRYFRRLQIVPARRSPRRRHAHHEKHGRTHGA